jgi:carboxypeptidase PM20D1
MTILLILIIATGILLAIMVLRAILVPAAMAPASIENSLLTRYAGVEKHLAALVRIPTVSHFDPAHEDDSAFNAFRTALSGLFPQVAARLIRTDINGRAIIMEWPGLDANLAPVILAAHFDVVPPGDAGSWDEGKGPFSGAILDGCVHGRGCQDIKITLTAALSAIESLLTAGFVPRRTVFLALGGDEETGGTRGAAAIADYLAGRGIRAAFILDEGGPVAKDMLGFADRPLALIGISEKGYVDIAIEASGSGGHASMPPPHTAAGAVARTVALSETRPFPAIMGYTVRRFLQDLSPYVPFVYRLLFRNLFITSPVVKLAFAARPTTNALIRTTSAATMLSGSEKENVLPESARAILNVRVLPGSSVAEAMARISTMAGRCGARAVLAHEGHANDPLPESPVEHEAYRMIKTASAIAFPEAGVVPFMFTAGTDTKHYRNLTDAIYRFTPLIQDPADIARIHAANERVSIENIRRCCLFYESLLRLV